MPPLIRARRSQWHFAGGIALLGAKVLAMQVDDFSFGDLAKPAERIAAGKVRPLDGPDGFRAHLLEHVVRLDLPSELRPELPLNVSGQWSAAELDELSQGGMVASLKSQQELGSWLGHEWLRRGDGKFVV